VEVALVDTWKLAVALVAMRYQDQPLCQPQTIQ
jgi:hypothetical protein